MSNDNSTFITKQQVIDFVQNMKNIEMEEFTLRKTAEQLKNTEPQRKALIAQIEESEKRVGKIYEELVSAEEYYKSYPQCGGKDKNYHIDKIKSFGAREEKLSEYQKFIVESNIKFARPLIDPPQCPPKPKKYDKIKASGKEIDEPRITFGQGIGIILLFPFLGSILLAILAEGLSAVFKYIPNFYDFIYSSWQNFSLVFFGIPFIIGLLFVILISSRDIKNYIIYGNPNKFQRMYDYERTKDIYDNVYLFALYWYEIQRYYYQKRQNEGWEKLSAFTDQSKKQADFLLDKANEIKYTKWEIYSNFPIIPPDYRTCDCVLMLHHIFRNDLADTMRDAILLYEERAFRGEIIKGMQKIYDMLENLTHYMKSIESQVRLIKNNVSFMVNDMQKAIEKHLDSTEDFQNDLLNEAQAIKYAMESVKRSNELLLLHKNQQRGTYYQ